MLSRFFLDRPVFAWVIAIVMMAGGALAIYNLPISQYPPLAPPSIYITAMYPGASAETVEATVTQIIEQKMTGLDRLWYLSATSDSSGMSRIELTFAPGTDPDLAWAKVQNKLQLAMASLPEVVQRTGVKVGKATRNYLLIVGLISEDGSMSGEDLRDYAYSNLEKVLARLPGVGEVEIFGYQYAMRIWLDPNKLTNYHLTVEDVIMALRMYNVEVSAGQFGGAPAVKGQRMNASIIVQHLLQTPEEFAAIPLRVNPDGSIVRIRDVARTELGTEFYDVQGLYNGKPAAAMAIRMMAGANALDTADRIKMKLQEMSRYFPPGMKVVYPYDTTPFTRVAIEEVVKTLFEAIFLVFIIMYVFLGTFRATLIPTIAVPVVILGTFAVLGILGYSINMLTMFAMILAIGLLVDDAIVVVENVERIMAEEGLPPKEATAKSMDQITSALIGIGLVLSAVFGPMAFFPGSTGILYRQFSATLIAAMLLSVVVALILTPVLCASLLKPVPAGHSSADSAVFFLRPFFRLFNRLFFGGRDLYIRLVGYTFPRKFRFIFLYLLIVGALGWLFLRMPTSYLPDEDQGILLVQATLPSGSTLEQTQKVMDEIKDYFLEKERDAVESFMSVAGISLAGRGQNVGMGFAKLKDWKLRKRKDLKVWAVQERAMRAFSQIRSAMVFAFPPPPVIELGNATGFDFELLDFGGLGHERLMAARNQLLGMAMQDPRLIRVRPNGMEELASKLPQGIGFDWTGLSYQERMATSQAPLLYAFSIFVILLVLAALYESWPIPVSILLCLPLGVIGGVIASSTRGLPNDVYFQIGLLTTLGLTTKNAILIVQFAKARVEQGMGLIEATLEGARLRLRPIVMTSMAFGFGVLPLTFATGAGGGAQKAIGTCVLGGMIASTFLATVFAPFFYVLIYRAFGKSRGKEKAENTHTKP
jgi:HAE1 family hydrophobic/amphiphilic exporter-1